MKSWNRVARPFLQLHGFKQYGKDGFGRMTHDQVFQFFIFNVHRHTHTFTLDISIRPMYCENQNYLVLRPGNRLGKLATKNGLDTWWPSDTDEVTEKSLTEVLRLLQESVLPFYNNTRTSEEIIKSYQKNFFGKNKFGDRVSWGSPGYECFDFGYIYLRAGAYEKALKEFERCSKFVSESNYESERQRNEKYLKLIELCKTGKQDVNAYLQNQIQNSLSNLKLADWLFADIYKAIARYFPAAVEQAEVEHLLQSINQADITVGKDQLARSILIMADGNLHELRRLFDTGFLGDPRDVIMIATGKTNNKSDSSAPFDY
ncbi:hypothetical protein [Lacibacter cauensis]|uniref:hypothetical protein n=1 Tax=Lacibacter cauensis TaxID=510947 RepID=UPI0011A973F6|nr:hypothetical protein [Lacibacter cauensis]